MYLNTARNVEIRQNNNIIFHFGVFLEMGECTIIPVFINERWNP